MPTRVRTTGPQSVQLTQEPAMAPSQLRVHRHSKATYVKSALAANNADYSAECRMFVVFANSEEAAPDTGFLHCPL